MAQTTLEDRLGADALKEIAREYFGRVKSSIRIGQERDVPRQKVPRLAKAGMALLEQEGPPADTGRA